MSSLSTSLVEDCCNSVTVLTAVFATWTVSLYQYVSCSTSVLLLLLFPCFVLFWVSWQFSEGCFF